MDDSVTNFTRPSALRQKDRRTGCFTPFCIPSDPPLDPLTVGRVPLCGSFGCEISYPEDERVGCWGQKEVGYGRVMWDVPAYRTVTSN